MNQKNGFSLIEVLIAMLIITAGLIALSAGLLIGVTLPQRARQQEVAKQLANTIMESIIAAKEAPRPGFDTFGDLDFKPKGRFESGVTGMLEAGPDGVYGTCDDGQASPAAIETCDKTSLGSRIIKLDIDPGKNGIYNDPAAKSKVDNRTSQLIDFTREVKIETDTNNPNVKIVTVRVNYSVATGHRETVELVCHLYNLTVL